MRTQVLGQKLLVKGAILAMERECKSLANWAYLDCQNLYLSYVKNHWKWKKFKSDIYLVFFFFSSKSEGISLRPPKNGSRKLMFELPKVRVNEWFL